MTWRWRIERRNEPWMKRLQFFLNRSTRVITSGAEILGDLCLPLRGKSSPCTVAGEGGGAGRKAPMRFVCSKGVLPLLPNPSPSPRQGRDYLSPSYSPAERSVPLQLLCLPPAGV